MIISFPERRTSPRQIDTHRTNIRSMLDLDEPHRIVGVQPRAHRMSSSRPPSYVHQVDIGIVTNREDEFCAVLDAFPQEVDARVHRGAHRQYIQRHAEKTRRCCFPGS